MQGIYSTVCTQVSSELVKSGSVVVVVDGTQYTAEAEERIVDRIIIEPGNQQVITNNKLYYGIGGGLGAALILGVVSSVVLGVVIYYYRRYIVQVVSRD